MAEQRMLRVRLDGSYNELLGEIRSWLNRHKQDRNWTDSEVVRYSLDRLASITIEKGD